MRPHDLAPLPSLLLALASSRLLPYHDTSSTCFSINPMPQSGIEGGGRLLHPPPRVNFFTIQGVPRTVESGCQCRCTIMKSLDLASSPGVGGVRRLCNP
jgi:hypothetical protein